ncbi:MAG: BrnT family toxin [Elusimicrobia bacterium]|nr:BrnT family toxin [Elusimicrobiota bacterium]
MTEEDFSRYLGFEWDERNTGKLWSKHPVSPFECEQIFFNQPLVVAPDESHSAAEPRFYVLGRTDADRPLFVVFTPRRNLVRIISARDMSRAESEVYRSHEEKNPEV